MFKFHCNVFISAIAGLQGQLAVTAKMESEQLLPFGIAPQIDSESTKYINLQLPASHVTHYKNTAISLRFLFLFVRMQAR